MKTLKELYWKIGAPPTNWFHPMPIQRNIAERSICTSKAQILSVISGLDHNYNKFMWDSLLVQKDLTINPLSQAKLNPSISEWEHFNGDFDYAATPLASIGCKIIIHTTPNKQKPWYKRRSEGFSVGPELHHYHFIQAIDSRTKSFLITYTAEYLHVHLTQPT